MNSSNNPAINQYNYLQELDTLRNKILQSVTNPHQFGISPPTAPHNQNADAPQITDLIVKKIQEEIPRQLVALGLVQQPPEPSASQADLQTTLEIKINQFAAQVLTKEHFDWLTDPQIFSSIPLFLKTQKGKDAIGSLVDEYKSYIDGV